MRRLALLTTFALSFAHSGSGFGQDAAPDDSNPVTDIVSDQVADRGTEVTRQLNTDERAAEVSAGILEPIYALAEHMSFSAFHWTAFALMVTGVVSYALQLVLGKLVVLSKLSLSLTAIISDAAGLSISLVGLFLTTQAAAENSQFTEHPASVLSATAVGAFAGLILYWWGQRQELQAVKGRSTASR